MAVEVRAARRRIIRRPRLTAILDDSSARVRLLVAPAGYGKTTLAREWLGEPERRAVWYRGGPASGDVAALAIGLAEAASEIIPDAGSRMSDRLRATGDPEEDVDILAELFAEDVQAWPDDAWLALDDYQFAMESAASERFVDLLTQSTPLQLLITSRRRPAWAAARRILYGEILEIDRRALAMSEAEAREVLGYERSSADELLARAQGWPAVLGLAALTADDREPGEELPDALYDYFAEELLQALSARARAGLTELAAVPGPVDLDITTKLLGAQTGAVLREGVHTGALSVRNKTFELHPLLRDFMIAGLLDYDRDEIEALARRLVSTFVAEQRWDDASYVVSALRTPALLPDLIAAALDDLLRDGRLQTLTEWLEGCATSHIEAPIVDLAEAEIAFRQGDYARAEALALGCAERLDAADQKAVALIRAAQAAMLGSRDEEALRAFRGARTHASSEHTRLEALVGECLAISELGMADDAEDVFNELARLPEGGLEMTVRRGGLELVRATRFGGIAKALASAKDILPLLDDVKSPLIASSFRNAYAHLLVVAARYEESDDLSAEQLNYAHEYRLEFAVPHALLIGASAKSGMRNFGAALELIEAAEDRAGDDVHIVMNAAARRMRIAIERHDFNTADGLIDDHREELASASMRAELNAYRALATACLGDFKKSDAFARTVTGIRGLGVEAMALSECRNGVRAVMMQRRDAVAQAVRAYRAVESLGALDCFVTASRASPDLLAAVASDPESVQSLRPLLSRANDFKLARLVGISTDKTGTRAIGTLTPREMEVSRLVARGYTNRTIAERLYISESTVKVHIRHALEKLGARTRAELAARVSAVE